MSETRRGIGALKAPKRMGIFVRRQCLGSQNVKRRLAGTVERHFRRLADGNSARNRRAIPNQIAGCVCWHVWTPVVFCLDTGVLNVNRLDTQDNKLWQK
jgi:hypothetical protein